MMIWPGRRLGAGMAELGETEDPKALVPGNAAAVGSTARTLRRRGAELTLAGKGLQRIDTADGWSGDAAEAFRAKFHGQPGKWLEAGDCFVEAAAALESYVYMLTWAQSEAAAAVKDGTRRRPRQRTQRTRTRSISRLAAPTRSPIPVNPLA
jgi:type VII secretion system ESX-1 substrate